MRKICEGAGGVMMCCGGAERSPTMNMAECRQGTWGKGGGFQYLPAAAEDGNSSVGQGGLGNSRR